MHKIRRLPRSKWSIAVPLLLLAQGLFKLAAATRRPLDDEPWLFKGSHYVTAAIWLVLALLYFLGARRAKHLPAAEFDESSLNIITPRALGKNGTVTVPFADITRFQVSEPTTIAIHFMKNESETIENLTGNAEDLAQFQTSVQRLKSEPLLSST